VSDDEVVRASFVRQADLASVQEHEVVIRDDHHLLLPERCASLTPGHRRSLTEAAAADGPRNRLVADRLTAAGSRRCCSTF
jgi:hypothetical protein